MKHSLITRYTVGLGGIALAGALFAGGFAVASAVDGDGTSSSSQNQTANSPIRIPGVARAEGGGVASTSAQAPAGPGLGADQAKSIYPGPGPYYCQGPLPNVVSGNSFDLSKANFTMRLLGAGFDMVSATITTESLCDDEGKPGETFVVVNTNWKHKETGFDVWLIQRQREKPGANVRFVSSATFWSNGYAFELNVNTGIYYLQKGGVEGGPDITLEPAASTSIRPPDSPDPRIEGVLNEAVAQLTPGLPAECFYRQVDGDWADLAKLGISDPRNVIPAGYKEQSSEVFYFTTPPASCNPVAFENQGSFFANWVDESDGKYNGSISVNAYALPEGSIPQLGWIDEYSVSWTNGKWQFNVSGNRGEKPLGISTLRTIAKAMDPSFSDACFLRRIDLKPSDLASRGLRDVLAPAGYKVANSQLSAVELPEGCAKVPEAVGNQYSLYWELADGDGNVINASVNRTEGGTDKPAPGGYIDDSVINWTGADGTYYSVSGYSREGGRGPGRDTLIAVAKSLDPAFDPDGLQEGGGTAITDARPAAP